MQDLSPARLWRVALVAKRRGIRRIGLLSTNNPYSPAPIDNLERNWDAKRRSVTA